MDNAYDDLHRSALKTIARLHDGPAGVWAYDAFEFINEEYFSGHLPYPRIVWAPTGRHHCLGFATVFTGRLPSIILHPDILDWGLGFAFDILVHEALHISVEYLVGRGRGTDGHYCEGWYAEVGRLLPLMGFDGIEIDDLPAAVVAGFPDDLMEYLGTAGKFYESGVCPVPVPW
jgi:hypothetical protein